MDERKTGRFFQAREKAGGGRKGGKERKTEELIKVNAEEHKPKKKNKSELRENIVENFVRH